MTNVVLVFNQSDELKFSAAHYLPGHPKCGVLHGHTYTVKRLELSYDQPTSDDFVDLGDIKAVLKTWDHVLIIPETHQDFWIGLRELFEDIKCRLSLRTVKGIPLVENIALAIAQEIKAIPRVTAVHLELLEGPSQGADVEI
jgi:6-pyruvoyltetrahydropterin/6-carboxytetrahydropterin synthase